MQHLSSVHPELDVDSSNTVLDRPSWFDRPLSNRWCVFGWVVATVTFVGVTQFLGGPTQIDASLSLYSTWAIAHGQLACAYPAGSAGGIPLRPPLYPLISGAFAALTHIGHGVTFPSRAALGAGCAQEVGVMARWAQRSGATLPSIRLGYVSWIALLAGFVSFLRASGRGRCGWEPTGLVVLAVAPPVIMSIQDIFHPEDLLAMGLALGSLACVRRGSWAWAGVLLGAAILSQQFILLIAAPLLVVAPRDRRIRFAGSVVGSAAIVVAPMAVMTSGRVLGSVIGVGNTPLGGATVLAQLHLHGAAEVALSRVLPVVLAMAMAGWAQRTLGRAILEPLPLASLAATALTLRLVFEVNLYGYYFMAVAVMLIVLDVLRGRISIYLIGWFALLLLAFDPVHGGDKLLRDSPPIWLWQIFLVPVAIALAARPMISAVRNHRATDVGVGATLGDRVLQ